MKLIEEVDLNNQPDMQRSCGGEKCVTCAARKKELHVQRFHRTKESDAVTMVDTVEERGNNHGEEEGRKKRKKKEKKKAKNIDEKEKKREGKK